MRCSSLFSSRTRCHVGLEPQQRRCGEDPGQGVGAVGARTRDRRSRVSTSVRTADRRAEPSVCVRRSARRCGVRVEPSRARAPPLWTRYISFVPSWHPFCSFRFRYTERQRAQRREESAVRKVERPRRMRLACCQREDREPRREDARSRVARRLRSRERARVRYSCTVRTVCACRGLDSTRLLLVCALRLCHHRTALRTPQRHAPFRSPFALRANRERDRTAVHREHKSQQRVGQPTIPRS
jgi:hypothetical protein